jgi:hypothetical protein
MTYILYIKMGVPHKHTVYSFNNVCRARCADFRAPGDRGAPSTLTRAQLLAWMYNSSQLHFVAGCMSAAPQSLDFVIFLLHLSHILPNTCLICRQPYIPHRLVIYFVIIFACCHCCCRRLIANSVPDLRI